MMFKVEVRFAALLKMEEFVNRKFHNIITQIKCVTCKKGIQMFGTVSKLNRKRRKKIPTNEITLNSSIKNLYAGFVELVSKNGRPLCIVEDSEMRLIIDPILCTGERVTLNIPIIKEKLHESYESVKKGIQAGVKRKLIALMLDIATKHNLSILGINVRYYTKNGFVMRTIGMELLTNSHTAQEIHKVLSNALRDFGIESIQIIAYNTDNAGNVVKVSNWLNEDCDNIPTNHGYEFDDNMFASMNMDFLGQLVDDICHILDQERILHIPCAVHREQLSVNDVLRMPEFVAEINFVKGIVKELRTPTFVNMLRNRNLKCAILDHEIRWNFTYLMVLL